MNIVRLKLCLFLCAGMIFVLGHGQVHADDKVITIAADEWCPVNCDPTGGRDGIGIEMARQIFEPLGYKIHYVMMPWVDAVRKVEEGTIDAVIGANQKDSARLIFPKTPVGLVADQIYALTSNPLVCTSLDSLRNRRIGIIAGYGYNEELEAFIQSQKNVSGSIHESLGEEALEKNIQELLNGDVDVIAESNVVMAYTLNEKKLTDKITKICPSFELENIYLAFSPVLKDSQNLADIFDAGVEKLTISGAFNDIYTKYGLGEM